MSADHGLWHNGLGADEVRTGANASRGRAATNSRKMFAETCYEVDRSALVGACLSVSQQGTIRYLGIEVDDALEIAEKINI